MQPDDPRHGSQAGRSQHIRDGEDPCPACIHGDLLAGRRRRKRRSMGHVYRLPVGNQLHERLTDLRDQGATYEQISQWSGVGFGQVYRVLNEGPTHRINTSTWLRLNNIKPLGLLTTVGATRRLRALIAIGYSLPRLVDETGLTINTLMDIRNARKHGPMKHTTKQALADAYDRLSMTPAPSGTAGEKKGRTRALNLAKANRWSPPLAWEAIDDPNERPTGRSRATSTSRSRSDVDPALVQRILDGDWPLATKATNAERREICRLWADAGRSIPDLETLTGWAAHRYWKATAA